MALKSVCVMMLAMVLAGFAPNNRVQWLTKKGARHEDRVLGFVNGGDFITCTRQTVKMSDIPDVLLESSNILKCPGPGFAASTDGGDDGQAEARAKRDVDVLKRLKAKPQ